MVIEWRGQRSQFGLLRQRPRCPTERPAEMVIAATQEPGAGAGRQSLHPRMGNEAAALLIILAGEANEIVEPDRDSCRINFGSFLLQPGMDIVVGIALHGLEVEFTGDFHHRPGAETVNLDLGEMAARAAKDMGEATCSKRPDCDARRTGGSLEPTTGVVELLNRALGRALGRARFNLIWSDLIFEVLDHVRGQNRKR